MKRKLSISMPSLETADHYCYLAWAQDAGFRAIECEIAHPDDLAVQQTVRQGLDRYGFSLSGIRTGISFALEGLCLSSAQPDIVEAATQRLIGINRFCARFPGCLNLIGLMQGRIAAPEEYPRARQQIITALKRICRSAEELGVRVSLEAVNHLLINYHNTLDSVAEILDAVDSPALGILADSFHMNIEEKDMGAALLKAGKQINHIHVADSNRWAPGRGHIDFAAFMQNLDEIGYQGWITVEADPKPDYPSMACEAYAVLRPLLQD
jgi:sugar phosphate isomerase/epimerase